MLRRPSPKAGLLYLGIAYAIVALAAIGFLGVSHVHRRPLGQYGDTGAVADVVGIGRQRFLRRVEGSFSGGEVNRLKGRLGEGLPAVDFAHRDLA